MKTYRTTATVVGILYILGTVAGVVSVVVTAGLLDASDVLATVDAHAGRAKAGALLILVMGAALAMVPALMFPVLKRQNEALAVGYVIFRGALETFTYLGMALCWLLLVADARQQAGAGTAASAPLPGIGTLLVKAMDPLTAIQDIVFSLGALMFSVLLFRSRRVPRWLSGWGIAAAVPYLTAGVIAVFNTQLVVLLMPLAVQEMVMAVWLIVKGFDPGVGALRAGTDERPQRVASEQP